MLEVLCGSGRLRRFVAIAAFAFFGVSSPVTASASGFHEPPTQTPRASRLDHVSLTVVPPTDFPRKIRPGPSYFHVNPDMETRSSFRPADVNGRVVQFITELGYDYSTQLQFPFRYAWRNPAGFVMGAAGLGALIMIDHVTQEILVPGDFSDRDDVMRAAEQLSKMADISSSYFLVAGFVAVGVLAPSAHERETGVMLCEAFVTSATWTLLLKKTTGRERPREADGGASDWTGPGGMFDNEAARTAEPRSFPSGHASGIWAAATILAHQYSGHKVVPPLAYGTAAAVSYSRMVVGAHWLSDVVVGGLIGYGCAKQVLSAHRDRRMRSEEPRLRVGADVSGDYKGISLRYDF